jgi:hypothetical protein
MPVKGTAVLEISSSHGGEYEVQNCLLECTAVYSSLTMEAVRTSETSVDNYFTRQYIQEDNSEQFLKFIALMMEEARTSETSVDIDLRTRKYIPEDSELHTRRRENLKSQTAVLV